MAKYSLAMKGYIEFENFQMQNKAYTYYDCRHKRVNQNHEQSSNYQN